MPEATFTRKHVSSKMEGGTARLADGMTGTGGSDHARLFGYLIRTVEVKNPGGGSDAIFTVEGGFRRDDETIDWYTLATRADASATFATTGRTVASGAGAIYEVSPTPVTDYVRINISDPTASGLDAWVHGEV
jgi:hypothetical protein